jgi:hypothetical protein
MSEVLALHPWHVIGTSNVRKAIPIDTVHGGIDLLTVLAGECSTAATHCQWAVPW